LREERNLLSVLRSGVGGTRPGHRMAYNADNEHNSDLDVLPDVLDDMAALRAEGHHLLMHCPGGLADRPGAARLADDTDPLDFGSPRLHVLVHVVDRRACSKSVSMIATGNAWG
jgi:hypothetical protein